ncbi:hypothetical protein CCMA1212_002237 [Trichoderma ghanense]|uniref:Uncharacterized protein n=1 Tax=Trichoderma ghanense TaxID=65468 RepID=A0ABY2HBF8_9HYPO
MPRSLLLMQRHMQQLNRSALDRLWAGIPSLRVVIGRHPASTTGTVPNTAAVPEGRRAGAAGHVAAEVAVTRRELAKMYKFWYFSPARKKGSGPPQFTVASSPRRRSLSVCQSQSRADACVTALSRKVAAELPEPAAHRSRPRPGVQRTPPSTRYMRQSRQCQRLHCTSPVPGSSPTPVSGVWSFSPRPNRTRTKPKPKQRNRHLSSFSPPSAIAHFLLHNTSSSHRLASPLNIAICPPSAVL